LAKILNCANTKHAKHERHYSIFLLCSLQGVLMNQYSKYLSTSKISKIIDINEKWLREKQGEIFKEGIHYHYPDGFHHCRWNVNAMLDWVENSSIETSKIANDILNSLSA